MAVTHESTRMSRRKDNEMDQISMCAAVISISLVQGVKLSSTKENYEIMPIEKEERILGDTIPIHSSLSLVGLNMLWDLISAIWSAIGYKLTAISTIANGAYWIFNHCGLVLLVGGGLLTLLGLCKFTGLCSLPFMEEISGDMNQPLINAARNLEKGFLKYGGRL